MGLRAGVRDVIELPAQSAQLLEAVERVAETIRVLPNGSGGGAGRERRRARAVTTVFSTKGGVGKSVIASTSPSRLPARPPGRWSWSTPTSSSARSR